MCVLIIPVSVSVCVCVCVKRQSKNVHTEGNSDGILLCCRTDIVLLLSVFALQMCQALATHHKNYMPHVVTQISSVLKVPRYTHFRSQAPVEKTHTNNFSKKLYKSLKKTSICIPLFTGS